MRPTSLIVCGGLMSVMACRDPDPVLLDGPVASGFAEDPDTPSDSTAMTAPATTSDTGDSGQPWGGTAYLGEIHGVLTVTFTSEHPLRDGDGVGMAGAYRLAEVGWDDTLDLYSPVAYQRAFPAPPERPDTLVPAQTLTPFDWGDADDWLVAGNGMKLRQGEDGPELLACLLTTAGFPVYRSSEASGVPEPCHGDPEAWAPQTHYDVVLYGGELFPDNVLLERITTPAAMVVTAPDLDVFDAPHAAQDDLVIEWEAGDDPEARVIIRVVDGDANLITVHAADDGAFTIPAAELAELTLGPIDLTIARERTDRVQFTDGGLTVLSRHERWGFLDLF